MLRVNKVFLAFIMITISSFCEESNIFQKHFVRIDELNLCLVFDLCQFGVLLKQNTRKNVSQTGHTCQ